MPLEDKFLAPPLLVTPDFCNLLSYYEIKLGPRGWIFKKEEKKTVIKYVKKIKINYFHPRVKEKFWCYKLVHNFTYNSLM